MEILVVLVIVGLGMYYGVFGVLERVIGMGHKELDQLEKNHEVSLINRSAKLNSELSDEKVVAAASLNERLKSLDTILSGASGNSTANQSTSTSEVQG